MSKVVVMGGSSIGKSLSRLLAEKAVEHGIDVKVLEKAVDDRIDEEWGRLLLNGSSDNTSELVGLFPQFEEKNSQKKRNKLKGRNRREW